MRKKSPRVVFVVTEEFLRTPRKTNPYIDPILDVCDRNGILYRFLMPHKVTCGYPEFLISETWVISLFAVWFWRIARLVWHVAPYRIYALFASIVRPFVAHKFDADLFIGSGSPMGELLAPLARDARIVDIQHGVIFSKHSGYFDSTGCLTALLQSMPNREFWLYGQGYADCFFKNHENNKWLDGRVKVIGDLLHANQPSTLNPQRSTITRDVIAVSLQFTTDFGKDVLQTWADDLCKVFEQIEAVGLQKRFPVVMRHHPRFGNSFDMGPMMKRFPWLQLTEESATELIAKAAYHITYMSTSAFEYAAEGVPTLFTASEKNRAAVDMMYGEFGYPIPLEFQQMAKALDDPKELARQGELVKAWYKKFYAPFDAENCLKLLKGEA